MAAQSRHSEASKRFDCLVKEIPSGLPHPDGAHRIKAAGREANLALVEHIRALKRYTDYIVQGIVPDDLTETESD
jgi:hypothetical protein